MPLSPASYGRCFELNGAPLHDPRAWSSRVADIVCLALFEDVFKIDDKKKAIYYDSFDSIHDDAWQRRPFNQLRIEHLRATLGFKDRGLHRAFLTVATNLDDHSEVAYSFYVEGFRLRLLDGEAGLNETTGEHRALVVSPEFPTMKRYLMQLRTMRPKPKG